MLKWPILAAAERGRSSLYPILWRSARSSASSWMAAVRQQLWPFRMPVRAKAGMNCVLIPLILWLADVTAGEEKKFSDGGGGEESEGTVNKGGRKGRTRPEKAAHASLFTHSSPAKTGVLTAQPT